MKMGEYIKQLRKNHGLTQEELGRKLIPPVNRAAVNKWESGQVENIKRSYIQQMAKLFGVKPCELMCFDKEERASQDAVAFERVRERFGEDAVKLLELFIKLNGVGKEKALEDLDDMASLPKYVEKGERQESLNA